jgi:voltage-gated potassium channel
MFHLIKRFRFLFLFILLLLFCLFKAIISQMGDFHLTNIVFGLLIASSLVIIGHKEGLLLTLITAILLAVLVLYLLRFYYNETLIDPVRALIVCAFFILMTVFCLYFTAQDQTISITTLFGSITAYLFIGLIFAYLYLFLELINPNSFSGLNVHNEAQVIYFSFITLTTVGYGEIYPTQPIAQTFVWFEAFSGQVYLAVIIGQLVSRYVAEHLQKVSNVEKGN